MEKKEVTLKELAEAFYDYDRERDAEWEFVDEHGIDDAYWSEEDFEEHQRILEGISEKRGVVNELLTRIDPELDLRL